MISDSEVDPPTRVTTPLPDHYAEIPFERANQDIFIEDDVEDVPTPGLSSLQQELHNVILLRQRLFLDDAYTRDDITDLYETRDDLVMAVHDSRYLGVTWTHEQALSLEAALDEIFPPTQATDGESIDSTPGIEDLSRQESEDSSEEGLLPHEILPFYEYKPHRFYSLELLARAVFQHRNAFLWILVAYLFFTRAVVTCEALTDTNTIPVYFNTSHWASHLRELRAVKVPIPSAHQQLSTDLRHDQRFYVSYEYVSTVYTKTIAPLLLSAIYETRNYIEETCDLWVQGGCEDYNFFNGWTPRDILHWLEYSLVLVLLIAFVYSLYETQLRLLRVGFYRRTCALILNAYLWSITIYQSFLIGLWTVVIVGCAIVAWTNKLPSPAIWCFLTFTTSFLLGRFEKYMHPRILIVLSPFRAPKRSPLSRTLVVLTVYALVLSTNVILAPWVLEKFLVPDVVRTILRVHSEAKVIKRSRRKKGAGKVNTHAQNVDGAAYWHDYNLDFTVDDRDVAHHEKHARGAREWLEDNADLLADMDKYDDGDEFEVDASVDTEQTLFLRGMRMHRMQMSSEEREHLRDREEYALTMVQNYEDAFDRRASKREKYNPSLRLEASIMPLPVAYEDLKCYRCLVHVLRAALPPVVKINYRTTWFDYEEHYNKILVLPSQIPTTRAHVDELFNELGMLSFVGNESLQEVMDRVTEILHSRNKQWMLSFGKEPDQTAILPESLNLNTMKYTPPVALAPSFERANVIYRPETPSVATPAAQGQARPIESTETPATRPRTPMPPLERIGKISRRKVDNECTSKGVSVPNISAYVEVTVYDTLTRRNQTSKCTGYYEERGRGRGVVISTHSLIANKNSWISGHHTYQNKVQQDLRSVVVDGKPVMKSKVYWNPDFPSSVFFNLGNRALPSGKSVWTKPPQPFAGNPGDPVFRQGHMSHSSGHIESFNEQGFITDYSSAGGDSGSPVFSGGMLVAVHEGAMEQQQLNVCVHAPVFDAAHVVDSSFSSSSPDDVKNESERIGPYAGPPRDLKMKEMTRELVASRRHCNPGSTRERIVKGTERYTKPAHDVTCPHYLSAIQSTEDEYANSPYYQRDFMTRDCYENEPALFYENIFLPALDQQKKTARVGGVVEGHWGRDLPPTTGEFIEEYGTEGVFQCYMRYHDELRDIFRNKEERSNMVWVVALKTDNYSSKKIDDEAYRTIQASHLFVHLDQRIFSAGWTEFIYSRENVKAVNDPTHPLQWEKCMPERYLRQARSRFVFHTFGMDYSKFDGSAVPLEWRLFYKGVPMPDFIKCHLIFFLSRGSFADQQGFDLHRLPVGNPSGNYATTSFNSWRNFNIWIAFPAKYNLDIDRKSFVVSGDDGFVCCKPGQDGNLIAKMFVEYCKTEFGIDAKLESLFEASPANFHKSAIFLCQMTFVYKTSVLNCVADAPRRISSAANGPPNAVVSQSIMDSLAGSYYCMEIDDLRPHQPDRDVLSGFATFCSRMGVFPDIELYNQPMRRESTNEADGPPSIVVSQTNRRVFNCTSLLLHASAQETNQEASDYDDCSRAQPAETQEETPVASHLFCDLAVDASDEVVSTPVAWTQPRTEDHDNQGRLSGSRSRVHWTPPDVRSIRHRNLSSQPGSQLAVGSERFQDVSQVQDSFPTLHVHPHRRHHHHTRSRPNGIRIQPRCPSGEVSGCHGVVLGHQELPSLRGDDIQRTDQARVQRNPVEESPRRRRRHCADFVRSRVHVPSHVRWSARTSRASSRRLRHRILRRTPVQPAHRQPDIRHNHRINVVPTQHPRDLDSCRQHRHQVHLPVGGWHARERRRLCPQSNRHRQGGFARRSPRRVEVVSPPQTGNIHSRSHLSVCDIRRRDRQYSSHHVHSRAVDWNCVGCGLHPGQRTLRCQQCRCPMACHARESYDSLPPCGVVCRRYWSFDQVRCWWYQHADQHEILRCS